MRLAVFLFQRSPWALVLAVCAGILSGFTATGLIAIANLAVRGQARTSKLEWTFAVLCLLLPVLRYISEKTLVYIGQDALLQLRLELTAQILNSPLRTLEEIGSPRILNAFTDDIPSASNGALSFANLCINLALVCGCFFYLGSLSVHVFVPALLLLLAGGTLYLLRANKGLSYLKAARNIGDSLMKHLKATTDGAKELKLHQLRREEFISQALRPAAELYRDTYQAALAIYISTASLGQFLLFIILGLILYAPLEMGHSAQAVMLGYSMVILFIMNPLQVIAGALPSIGRANIALRKLSELGLDFLNPGSLDGIPAGIKLQSTLRTLEMRGVTHMYDCHDEDRRFVLGPVSLMIVPGELIFIVGGNGSGKTTLIKLLVGLYTPEAGQILWNGLPVCKEHLEAYRQNFSAVFSDFFLFESLLGISGKDVDSRAQYYLEKFSLDRIVHVRDRMLSSTSLSQGQRKRLALLVSYLEDRPIYVFDEWAADQDPVFKEIFYHELLPDLKRRGKTVLAVTHDDHYYGVADRIIKLDYGAIKLDQYIQR